jgi:hypothetical protein
MRELFPVGWADENGVVQVTTKDDEELLQELLLKMEVDTLMKKQNGKVQ